MVGYLVRRLLLAVFVLWGVATTVFLIVRVVPADPALLIAGSDASPEQLTLIRQDLGLDQSLIVQYGSSWVALVEQGAIVDFDNVVNPGQPVAVTEYPGVRN